MRKWLSEHSGLIAVAAVGVALVCAGFALFSKNDVFAKLPMVTKLAAPYAALLTPEQISGKKNLFSGSTFDTGNDAEQRTTMAALRRSMEWDVAHGWQAVCALHYNVPISMCLFGTIGNVSNVYVYNLNMTGYSHDSAKKWPEKSAFCEGGTVDYWPERFVDAWFRFLDRNGYAQWIFVEGAASYKLQHAFWLNHGVLPCHELSINRQAMILYEMRLKRLDNIQHLLS